MIAYWLALKNTSDNVEVTGRHSVCTRMRLSAVKKHHIPYYNDLLSALCVWWSSYKQS